MPHFIPVIYNLSRGNEKLSSVLFSLSSVAKPKALFLNHYATPASTIPINAVGVIYHLFLLYKLVVFILNFISFNKNTDIYRRSSK